MQQAVKQLLPSTWLVKLILVVISAYQLQRQTNAHSTAVTC